MKANVIILLPELVLTAAAMLLLMVGAFAPHRGRKVVVPVATIGLLLAAACVFILLPRKNRDVLGIFVLDEYAAFFKLLFCVVGILLGIGSANYVRIKNIMFAEFYSLLLIAIVGMMVVVSSINFTSLFTGLELAVLCSYILIGIMREDMLSNEAMMKYFLLSIFSTAFFLFGVGMLYGATKAVSFGEMGTAMTLRSAYDPMAFFLSIAVSFVIMGMGFKMVAAPFHMYAPDVYQGAPTPTAAFLAVGTKVAAFAALLRIVAGPLSPLKAQWIDVVWIVAVLSMVWGSILAMRQTNLKRLLACSSVAHAGYALVGVVAVAKAETINEARLALAGTVLYLTAYVPAALGAFLVLLALRRSGEFGESLDDLIGLRKRHPYMAFAMLIFMLSLAGIPLTIGFVAKVHVVVAAIGVGAYGITVIGLATSVMAVYYHMRVVSRMYSEETASGVEKAPLALRFTVAVAAAIAVFFGIFPDGLVELAARSVEGIF